MATRKSSGFTLVELLVVIAIMGMLMGLLMVAIGGATVAANKTASQNNLKEISKGFQIYESRKGRYPGYLQQYRPAQGMNPALNGSWVVAIMPYIGRQDLYDFWADTTQPAPDESITIPTLMCPGDEQDTAGGPWLSYGVNNGIPDTASETRAHGIFFDHRASVTNKVVVNAGDIQRRDGLSNTLLAGENVRAYTWSGRTNCAMAPCPQQEFLLGFNWHLTSTTIRPVNQTNSDGTLATTTATNADHARLNSPHSGGACVAFADGHVMFLSDSITYLTYNKLCTPDGSAFSQAPLDAAEYAR